MEQNWESWESRFVTFLEASMDGDAAHDMEHIRRVVRSAKELAREEGASLDVVIPAAWLHDCVTVPKSSPLRSKASGMAAESALVFLKKEGYPEDHFEPIYHAIEAHSFSANIPTRSIEAAVVQDADRLDAIGAIGIARCLMTSVIMNRPIYVVDDPFSENRTPEDRISAIDHFYTKLLKLPESMKTKAGKLEADRRVGFMYQYLDQLRSEI